MTGFWNQLPVPAGDTEERLRTALDFGRRGGSTVHRRLRDYGLGRYEPRTQATLLALMDRLPERSVFFDVGAHVGLYSALAESLFGQRGLSCYAFEPTPKTARKAEALRDLNRLSYPIIRVAASSSTGEVDLFLSTTAETSNSLNAAFRPGSTPIRVRTNTIDNLVSGGLPMPTLMKIDVETHEPEVLAGARRTIEEARPIIVCELLQKGDPFRIAEEMLHLERLGYTMRHILPHGEFPQVAAADVAGNRSRHREWVIAPPDALNGFEETYARWRAAVARCVHARQDGKAAGADTAGAEAAEPLVEGGALSPLG